MAGGIVQGYSALPNRYNWVQLLVKERGKQTGQLIHDKQIHVRELKDYPGFSYLVDMSVSANSYHYFGSWNSQ